jgi:hypothetical protein
LQSKSKIQGSETSARAFAIALALVVYLVWVAMTFILEGRIHTLLRPEAVVDRVVYAVVANMVVGTGVAIWGIARLRASGLIELAKAGFGSPSRTVLWVVAGGVVGFIFYAAQNPPSMDLIVLSNGYAQVLTGTIAEVLVCWALVGTTFESLVRQKGRTLSLIVGIGSASVLFGAYHFAHSPPFNTISLVVFLMLIGVITSIFFFVSRNVYGTIVFHNFLGIFGVLQALAASGNLATFAHPLYPLYALDAISVLILVVLDVRFLRRRAT